MGVPEIKNNRSYPRAAPGPEYLRLVTDPRFWLVQFAREQGISSNPTLCEILKANTRVISKAFRQIPHATEQGIISAEQGILAGTGNFPHVIDQKPIRIKGLEPPTRPLCATTR
jgi:hypothetical protein